MDTRRKLGRPRMDSRARAKGDSRSEAGEVGGRCAVKVIPREDVRFDTWKQWA